MPEAEGDTMAEQESETEADDDRQCVAASMALMDVLVEECGSGDQLIGELSSIMGVPDTMIKDGGSYTKGCHEILRQGTDDLTARQTNAYVVCRSREMLSSGDADTMREAIDKAWDEL
jgi:hypothetical protein